MSQHDFSIANQTASSARADINNGLQALASNNSGGSAPSTTYANMFWYDTTNNLLKVRDETDSSWINVLYINQGTNEVSVLNDTNVVTTGGSTTGLIGDQLQSVWNTGTGTTESLISPAKLKAGVLAHETTPPSTFATIGTYSFMQYNSGTLASGDIVSGTLVRPASVNSGGFHTGSYQSGTWRCMAVCVANQGSLFLRLT